MHMSRAFKMQRQLCRSPSKVPCILPSTQSTSACRRHRVRALISLASNTTLNRREAQFGRGGQADMEKSEQTIGQCPTVFIFVRELIRGNNACPAQVCGSLPIESQYDWLRCNAEVVQSLYCHCFLRTSGCSMVCSCGK